MRYVAPGYLENRAAHHLAGLLALASLSSAIAAADTVTLHGRPAFEHVEVLAYKQGIVHFRGLSKQTLRKPPDQIDRIAIDGLDRFNAAEQAAAERDWPAALAAYDAAAAAASGWTAELIAARRMAVLDASGAFDQAVSAYIVTIRATGAVGLPPRPSNPGPTGSPTNRAARQALEDAVRAARNPSERKALRSFLLEMLLIEDEPPPLRLFPPPAPETATPQRATPVGERRIKLDLPTPRPSGPRAESVSLPVPTLVRAHVLRLLDAAAASQAARTAERALAYATAEARPAWTLLLGRARVESGDAARAAADLIALSEEATDPSLVCEALYYAALAHERLDRPDVAATLYRELRARDDVPAELRERVAEGLDRVD